ncbi:hypothetical protein [Roseomonas sp. BN140053]|uniref:hypothetical protein n=1 Tax=Roseomonas sp. BN140053 TaxID=3391898 RepID=UPI0039E9ED4C
MRIGTTRGADDLVELAELWRAALQAPQHAPGCACSGGFALPLLAAGDLEEDILDFLQTRYAAEGLTALLPALHARAAARAAGGIVPGFGTWLMGLDAAALPPAARERLVDDLRRTLLSFGGTAARAGRFACT